ncbi:MAG: DnaD domain protein [Ruminococcus sp.]|nr:DnaD domain protein [Ruminococcus sp.]
MIYKLGMLSFGRFFNVPCGAVDNYLKPVSGDFYKVLLAALSSDSMFVDTAVIADRCGVTASAAEEALLFWGSTGVIELSSTDGKPAASATAVQAMPAVSAAAPVSLEKPELPVSTVEAVKPTKTVSRSNIRYTPKEIAQKAKDDNNVQVLFDEVQKVFGRVINASDSAALIDLYEFYGFDVPSILILAQYCTDIGKNRMAYMLSVAQNWFDRGICEYEQVEREIVRLTAQNDIDHKLCVMLGVEEPPTKKQKEYFSNWTEWGYGEDMIMIAAEKCRDSKNKTDLRYMNGIIKRWHGDGILSPEVLQKREQSFKQTKAAASPNGNDRSYDLDKWHRMADNLDFDNINFGNGDKE